MRTENFSFVEQLKTTEELNLCAITFCPVDADITDIETDFCKLLQGGVKWQLICMEM